MLTMSIAFDQENYPNTSINHRQKAKLNHEYMNLLRLDLFLKFPIILMELRITIITERGTKQTELNSI